MLNLIKKYNNYAVYLNTTTAQYELWLVNGDKLIDQDDVFTDLQDALECMEYADDLFEEWFYEDLTEEYDITAEDLAEWQDASCGRL